MIYFSIDIETTGLSPKHNDILEIAAVVDDLDKDIPVEELPFFHCFIYNEENQYRVSPYTALMHERIWKILDNRKNEHYEFYKKEEVGNSFYDWLNHLLIQGIMLDFDGNKYKINVAGKNFDSFDRQFLIEHRIFNPEKVEIHKRTIDPAILFFKKSDECLPSSEKCRERLGIKAEGMHTALGDAKDVVKLVRSKLC